MKCSELRRILFQAGWRTLRQGKGSHVILVHSNRPGEQIVFYDHGSAEVGKGMALKILKQAGMANLA